jgi:adenine-specific DNA-methyltransferase
VRLLRQLIEQSSNDGDVVLDFFAGSATTAQAVMEINAEEAGSRRFIMVSSTEASSNEPDNNICREVTAERLRRLNALNTGKYADMSAAFAYLRTREIDFDALNTDLAPAEAWNALEAMHDLPLTPYNEARGWDEHVGDGLTLILADRTEESMIARLRELAAARANVFVYSWAPGQVRNVLGPVDFDVLPVRETLVKRFTA